MATAATATAAAPRKPFVGGAEAARQRARKKARTPPVGNKIVTPLEQQRLQEMLPPKMNTMERFAASLLRSSPADFVAAAAESDNDAKSDALWRTICRRVGIAPSNIPTRGTAGHVPILPRYEKSSTHFEVRAALVLEEARHAISQPLAALWRSSNNNHNSNGGGKGGGARGSQNGSSSSSSMILTAFYSEKSNSNGHARVFFKKDRPFTRDELYNIRPGAVFQCQPRDERSRSIHNVVLGMIFSGNRDLVEKKKEFQVVMFRDLTSGNLVEGSEWIVTPLTSLITELRCFEAMAESACNVSFMHDLLGKRMDTVATSTHTRFDPYTSQPITTSDGTSWLASTSGDPNSSDNDAVCVDEFATLAAKTATCSLPPLFKRPILNKTQEQAASTFLKSPQNTITLIQGPPGTVRLLLSFSMETRFVAYF
jgi:hypothetical protein